MIDINKCKRRDGGEFVILSTNGKNPNYPLIVEYKNKHGDWEVDMFTANGEQCRGGQGIYDLIEVGPYDHIKPGDLVMVWGTSRSRKWAVCRVFAGVNEHGKPMAFSQLRPWQPMTWEYCLTIEEYADKYLRKENTDE